MNLDLAQVQKSSEEHSTCLKEKSKTTVRFESREVQERKSCPAFRVGDGIPVLPGNGFPVLLGNGFPVLLGNGIAVLLRNGIPCCPARQLDSRPAWQWISYRASLAEIIVAIEYLHRRSFLVNEHR